MVTGAKTWYPGLDERCGTYQLLKAEVRAQKKYASEMVRIQRLRQLHERGFLGTSAPSMSSFMSPPAAGQLGLQQAGSRNSFSGGEGSLYSYPSARSNQNQMHPPQGSLHPGTNDHVGINGQNKGMPGNNPAQYKGGNGQNPGGGNGQNQGGMNPQNKGGNSQNQGGMNGQNKGGNGQNHGSGNGQNQGSGNGQNKGMNGQSNGGNGPNQGMMDQNKSGGDQNQGMMGQGKGGNGQNQGMMGQNKGGNIQIQVSKSQNQGMNGQNQGMNGQNQGMITQNKGGNVENQGINGQNHGGNGKNQGMVGQNKGGNGQNQGMNHQTQGMNHQTQGMNHQTQGTNGQSHGMNGQNHGQQGTNLESEQNKQQQKGMNQGSYTNPQSVQNAKGQGHDIHCTCEHGNSVTAPHGFQTRNQTAVPGFSLSDGYKSPSMFRGALPRGYPESILSYDSHSPLSFRGPSRRGSYYHDQLRDTFGEFERGVYTPSVQPRRSSLNRGRPASLSF